MLNEKTYFRDLHFFIALCMRYIVSAEPKSFFNYENRTETTNLKRKKKSRLKQKPSVLYFINYRAKVIT